MREAPNALWRAAWLYLDLGEKTEARRVFLELGTRYPRDADAPEALYRAGLIALRKGEEDAAWEAMQRAAGGPLGKFYVHRALERLAAAGRDEVQAGQPLGGPGITGVVRPRRGLAIPPAPIDPAWESRPAIKRLLFFGGHGLEEAEWEALELAPLLAAGEASEPLMRAFAEAGVAASAMEYAAALDWAGNAGDGNTRGLRVAYPLAYWEATKEVAQEAGIDPLLIVAVARQESRFKARAVSWAGATGVMQLMPPTARWLAEVEPAVTHDSAVALTRPKNSLRMGAHYLVRMIDRADGHLVYAACAYNAGPGNMSKWRRRLPSGDADALIDAIPYPETKGFVKHVLGNYAAYCSLYRP
jgi:soluble lytic murein transglycosylase-like protein